MILYSLLLTEAWEFLKFEGEAGRGHCQKVRQGKDDISWRQSHRSNRD